MREVLVCVDRDRLHGKIVAYKLQDEHGNITVYSREKVFNMLLNNEAYIENLRLTQRGSIIALHDRVMQNNKGVKPIKEREAEEIQDNFIGLVMMEIQRSIKGNVQHWKIDETHNISQIDKTYFVYTGKKIDVESKAGRVILDRLINDRSKNTVSPRKIVNRQMLQELGFIVKLSYTVDRLMDDAINGISAYIYMTTAGSLDPIEVDGKAVGFGVNNIRETQGICIRTNVRTMVEYLDK